ncbi:MAG: hypothetical protein R3B49_08075 [Phycisphaerales bacterium]
MWTPARAVFVVALLAYGWVHFEWAHEAGHVVGALATGGRVQQVVLHPAAFSRTDVTPNPAPLVEVWSGPALGCVFGVIAGAWTLALPRVGAIAWRGVGGLVLLANGVYIGVGPVAPAGDTEVMRQLGTPGWVMVAFGVAACAGGVWMWRGARARLPDAPIGWAHALVPLAAATALGTVGAIAFPGP